jgi:hypothetical protein
VPKLDKKTRAATEKAEAWGEGGGFALLPEGRYAGRLTKVDEREARSATQFPSWSWEFRHLHNEDGEEQRGRMWNNTSMSPKALGNLKAQFEALGFTLDSDTDEMIGEWCVLYVTQEVQTQGKNAGKTVNRVNGVAAFDESEWDFEPSEVAADKDEVAAPEGDSAF